MDLLNLIITVYFMCMAGIAVLLMLLQYREIHYNYIKLVKEGSHGQACDALLTWGEEEKRKRMAAEAEVAKQAEKYENEIAEMKRQHDIQFSNVKHTNRQICAAVMKGAEL